MKPETRGADMLNPMVSGSGTNLKMLEYAAAGLPIVSTFFGGRGGILQEGTHYVGAEIEDFAAAVCRMAREVAQPACQAMAQQARERATEAGDWRAIAATMFRTLTEHGLISEQAKT